MFRTQIMHRARERAVALSVRNVVVATNSGRSVLAARAVFGDAFRLYAVGNPVESHRRGLCLPSGISEGLCARLESDGIEVIRIDQTLFQGPPRCDQAREQHAAIARSYARRFFKDDRLAPGSTDLVEIAGRVLNEFLGDGPRVCLEIALAAADSGRLPLDSDCMAIATPSSYCGLPDAALVLRPVRSEDAFSQRLRIKDLLLCPSDEDVWFSDRALP